MTALPRHGSLQGSVRGIGLSFQVSQDKPVNRFHCKRRAGVWDFLTVDLLGIMLRTGCLSLLWILKAQTKPNRNSSYYPFLLRVSPNTHDMSSDGPVAGQRDRNVGWPNGQHYSAREEKAVSARFTFPPTIWQQVRAHSLLIVCADGLRLCIRILFYLSFFILVWWCTIRFFSCLFALVSQKVAQSSAEADWRPFKLWPPLSAQVSSESESGKHQRF